MRRAGTLQAFDDLGREYARSPCAPVGRQETAGEWPTATGGSPWAAVQGVKETSGRGRAGCAIARTRGRARVTRAAERPSPMPTLRVRQRRAVLPKLRRLVSRRESTGRRSRSTVGARATTTERRDRTRR